MSNFSLFFVCWTTESLLLTPSIGGLLTAGGGLRPARGEPGPKGRRGPAGAVDVCHPQVVSFEFLPWAKLTVDDGGMCKTL